MALTLEQVRWVAHLARLELTPSELERMTHELGDILAYVEQLGQVDTEGVDPLTHPLPVHNVFREDEPSRSLSVADALANAPCREGDFFAVPSVLD